MKFCTFIANYGIYTQPSPLSWVGWSHWRKSRNLVSGNTAAWLWAWTACFKITKPLQLMPARAQGPLISCQQLLPSQDGEVFVFVRFAMLLQNRWNSLFVLVDMNISDLNEIHFSCFGFIPNNQFMFPVRALGFREREMVSEIFWLKINFRLIEFWADPTQPQIPPFLVHSHPKCKKSACLISPQL